MKLNPLAVFAVVVLVGVVMFGGSAVLSALGDAASQRSDAGVVGLLLVALVVAGAIAAAVTAAFNKARKAETTEKK